MAFVWFDESFNYNNTSHKITDKDDNDAKLGNIWNETDDEEFSKVMAGKQVVKIDATLAPSTFQSYERSIVADSKKKEDNNSFLESAIDNNHHLPNQLLPLPVVPKLFANLDKEEDIPRLPDI